MTESDETPRLADRRLSPRSKKRLTAVFVLLWLSLVGFGAAAGYVLAGASHRLMGVIVGGFTGWLAMIIVLWVFLVTVTVKRDPRAGR